jgi:hypothetical protein
VADIVSFRGRELLLTILVLCWLFRLCDFDADDLDFELRLGWKGKIKAENSWCGRNLVRTKIMTQIIEVILESRAYQSSNANFIVKELLQISLCLSILSSFKKGK